MHRVVSGWELAPIVLVHSGRPYSYEIYGGPELNGGHPSINGSGGALYLPTIGRNTLRLPDSVNADLRVGAGVRVDETAAGRAADHAAGGGGVQRDQPQERVFRRGACVFSLGPSLEGPCRWSIRMRRPLRRRGLNTQPFGTVTAASTGLARERQMQLSLRPGVLTLQ